MLTRRFKNISKVAILCIAVSLLSFVLGAKIGGPFYVFNKNGKIDTTATSPGETYSKADRLKPISDVMNLIEERYVKDVNHDKLIEGAIKGMVESLDDPYSVYMPTDQFQDFITTINGSFGGVGISLGFDEKTGSVVVVSPIEETPAHKAGILPKDTIVKVDDVDLDGKNLDEAVKLLRGEKGTKVTVYIKRAGEKDLLKFKLVRDNIRVKTVKHEVMDNNIGYIKITSFDSQTHKDFKAALAKLKISGVQGLILDLRNNPGGSLDESVKIADEILGQGLIVYTEDKNKNKLEEFYSDDNKISVPLVVLINENSASASEIVAGAIQDHKAGTLVGMKTYGKGSVQELEPFENGAGLKITIARYYIPSGRSIDGVGVMPDVKVELENNINPFDIPREKDAQLQKAMEILNSAINN